MLDLRQGLGATWRCQVVVRITVKAKLVGHLNEVDYLVVIDCWHRCIIHTEQVFDLPQLFSSKVDLELQASCIESSDVYRFSSIWIWDDLSQNVFPLIGHFIGNDLLIIFQTFEIKWGLWLVNLDNIVFPEVGSWAFWFISLSFVHGVVKLWRPRLHLLLLNRWLWLLNIVVKTELNQFLDGICVSFLQIHPLVRCLNLWHSLSFAFVHISVSDHVGGTSYWATNRGSLVDLMVILLQKYTFSLLGKNLGRWSWEFGYRIILARIVILSKHRILAWQHYTRVIKLWESILPWDFLARKTRNTRKSISELWTRYFLFDICKFFSCSQR
mgnify:CR=1 FL=1